MLSLLYSLVIAAIFYLLPGFILISCLDTRRLSLVEKLFLSLALSLVTVPYFLASASSLFHFQLGLIPWLILVVMFAGVSVVLRLLKKRPVMQSVSAAGVLKEPHPLEQYGVLLFLLGFAAFCNLPRILMFMQGEMAMDVAPWDENWHIQQLVSVARTGIPPTHYFFPSIKLAYYYASWIYPATLGNLPGPAISLMRAMSIHSFVVVFTFLGLANIVLQKNIKQVWVRLAGLAFFTIMGGFDLFTRLPNIESAEWWMRNAGWLTGSIQISQFATLYAWVPHHLSAGLGFLLLILMWKNLSFSLNLKVFSTAVILAFIFISSPFVFLATAVAVLIVALTKIRWLWNNRSTTLLWIGVGLVLFLLATWQWLFLYTSHQGSITLFDLRINILERYRGIYPLNRTIDQIVTLVGLPLVGGYILFIEMGLMFVLYAVWWFDRLFSRKPLFETSEDVLIGVFPIVCTFGIFLFHDLGGGENFAMRGFIPAQIVMTLTAVLVLGKLDETLLKNGKRRWVLIYLFFCFFAGQGLSALGEIRALSAKQVKLALWQECGWGRLLNDRQDQDEYCYGDSADNYIYWLNRNTPTNALILENRPSSDSIHFWWLERNRFLLPQDHAQNTYAYYDMDFILPADWQQLSEQLKNAPNVLEGYQQLKYPGKGAQPVYLVWHVGTPPPVMNIDPVYQDNYVVIFPIETE